MQPSATSVICFSWREIEASRGSDTGFPEDGNDSSSESDDGNGNAKRILDNSEIKIKQLSQHGGGGEESEIFHLGGELSRSEWLVHGSISPTIRFSYR